MNNLPNSGSNNFYAAFTGASSSQNQNGLKTSQSANKRRATEKSLNGGSVIQRQQQQQVQGGALPLSNSRNNRGSFHSQYSKMLNGASTTVHLHQQQQNAQSTTNQQPSQQYSFSRQYAAASNMTSKSTSNLRTMVITKGDGSTTQQPQFYPSSAAKTLVASNTASSLSQQIQQQQQASAPQRIKKQRAMQTHKRIPSQLQIALMPSEASLSSQGGPGLDKSKLFEKTSMQQLKSYGEMQPFIDPAAVGLQGSMVALDKQRQHLTQDDSNQQQMTRSQNQKKFQQKQRNQLYQQSSAESKKQLQHQSSTTTIASFLAKQKSADRSGIQQKSLVGSPLKHQHSSSSMTKVSSQKRFQSSGMQSQHSSNQQHQQQAQQQKQSSFMKNQQTRKKTNQKMGIRNQAAQHQRASPSSNKNRNSKINKSIGSDQMPPSSKPVPRNQPKKLLTSKHSGSVTKQMIFPSQEQQQQQLQQQLPAGHQIQILHQSNSCVEKKPASQNDGDLNLYRESRNNSSDLVDDVQETIEAERPSFKGTDGSSVRKSLTASSSNYSYHGQQHQLNQRIFLNGVNNRDNFQLASNGELNPFEMKNATNMSMNQEMDADVINFADLKIPQHKPSPSNSKRSQKQIRSSNTIQRKSSDGIQVDPSAIAMLRLYQDTSNKVVGSKQQQQQLFKVQSQSLKKDKKTASVAPNYKIINHALHDHKKSSDRTIVQNIDNNDNDDDITPVQQFFGSDGEEDLEDTCPQVLLTNEENLLEQTLGQTLTQQKRILDNIDRQTYNRNHMQLMNRYLGGDDIEDSSFKQLSQQQSSASKVTVMASADSNQRLTYEPKSKVSTAQQSKIMLNMQQVMADSGINTNQQNTPQATNKAYAVPNLNLEEKTREQLGHSSSAFLASRVVSALNSEKQDAQVVQQRQGRGTDKLQRKTTSKMNSKANTAQTSPLRRNQPNLFPKNDSVTEQVLDEFGGTDAIAQRVGIGNNVSQTALGHYGGRNVAATPGQAMNNLKDRRSMSRLDVMKRSSYNNMAATGMNIQKNTGMLKELNSTGKKDAKLNQNHVGLAGVVRSGGMSRDLSMPRLRRPVALGGDRSAEQVGSDDYIPNQLPPTQRQIGQKGQPLIELNLRLSYLTTMNGPSFQTPQYRSLRSIDIRNNKISELPGEICTLNQLTHMKLDYNYLQSLPFSLGSVRSLVHISASQNKLQELPDSLFHKESQLQTLLLNDNKINVLSRGLGKLIHLKTLYVHNNVLVEIPTSLCQLGKLVEFSLDWLLYIEEKQQKKLAVSEFNPQSDKKENKPEEEKGRPSERITAVAPNQELTITAVTDVEKGKRKKTDEDQTRKNTQGTINPTGNRKVLKGEKGNVIVREIKSMLKFFDSAQRNMRSEAGGGLHQYRSIGSSAQSTGDNGIGSSATATSQSGFLHFIQFLMYFHQVPFLTDVRSMQFSHKQRLLVHQLGLNGHLYLLKATIAVLGINRPMTSLDLNAPDDDNSTCLLLAMKQKKMELVKYLLRLPQTRTNVYSLKYGLPLHVALAQSEFKLASKLIRTYYSEPRQTDSTFEVDVNVANEYGNTPLHLVFLNFQKAPEIATILAKLMIKKGADLHCRNQHELGILHLAVQTNNMMALKFALTHNKQIRTKRKMKKQYFKENNKETSNDIMSTDPDLFDFNGRGGKNQGTILHSAIFHTNLAIITLILQCGEFYDLTALDSNGKRAIDLCPYSSPIFKSIRNRIKQKIRSQAEVAFKLQQNTLPMSNQMIDKGVNSIIAHRVFSARECIVAHPAERRTIETMQQLTSLKQLPAEQMRQDVPPGPGPYPQKNINYNSNPITEHQAAMVRSSTHSAYGDMVLNQAIAEAAVIEQQQLQNISQHSESDFHDSDKGHTVLIPSAFGPSASLITPRAENNVNDVAMNVPTSFDYRGENNTASFQGPPKSSRLNSNHLQLVGATNPIVPVQNDDKSRASNQFSTSAMLRISSLKDDEMLQSQWHELINNMGQGQSKRDIDDLMTHSSKFLQLQNTSDRNNAMGVGHQKNDSIQSANNLLKKSDGSVNNMMIYSTLAAAFPYEHKATAVDLESPLNRSKFNITQNAQPEANPKALPTPIETENQLDLSIHHTQMQLNDLDDNDPRNIQQKIINVADDDDVESEDEEDDSGDNLDDIDEKALPVNDQSRLGRDGQITPTSGIATTTNLNLHQHQIGQTENSDGENVDIDEDEMQSKAFEARESQWNRKLSIKHSEEKKFNQKKSDLSRQIVNAFEEARNYHYNNPVTPGESGLDHLTELPQVAEMHQNTSQHKRIQIPLLNFSKKDKETTLKSDQIQKILDTANKNQSSNKKLMSSPAMKVVKPQSSSIDQQINAKRLSAFKNKMESPNLQTHNFNLMSTVKVTDLKLHLNQHNSLTIGAADSHRVFGGDDNLALRGGFKELEEIADEVCIKENDSTVLLWAYNLTSIKIKHQIKNLLKFIELLAVANLIASPEDIIRNRYNLPTHTQLIFNLHELENIQLLKTNEVNQKTSMKLIIINSTGRHRRAPSEFQSAKTIKRHEMQHPQAPTRRIPSMNQTKRLLAPGVYQDNRFQKQQRKDYREEDSMMYDSNMPPQQSSYLNDVIDNIGKGTTEDIDHHEYEDDADEVDSSTMKPDRNQNRNQRLLAHSKSTSHYSALAHRQSVNGSQGTTLRDLIGESATISKQYPQYRQVNNSAGDGIMRKEHQSITTMHQSASQPRIRPNQVNQRGESALGDAIQIGSGGISLLRNNPFESKRKSLGVVQTSRGRSKQQALRNLVDGRFKSASKKSSGSIGGGRNNRVSIEGKTHVAFGDNEYNEDYETLQQHYSGSQKQRAMTFYGQTTASQPNLHTGFIPSQYKKPHYQQQQQVGITMTAVKKGVTSGMKLFQPTKKNDAMNLDLTMQVDANEELTNEERKQKLILVSEEDENDPMMFSSDIPFNDGALSSPNVNLETQEPLKSRMIGEIQQFNMIMQQANKDSFDKRGIGMYLRQQNPLGSIALSSHESVNKSIQSNSTQEFKKLMGAPNQLDSKRYFN